MNGWIRALAIAGGLLVALLGLVGAGLISVQPPRSMPGPGE
jgi:hypothetical protein